MISGKNFLVLLALAGTLALPACCKRKEHKHEKTTRVHKAKKDKSCKSKSKCATKGKKSQSGKKDKKMKKAKKY